VNITLNYTDDTTSDHEVIKRPWTYGRHLVLDEGREDRKLTYVPLAALSSWLGDNPEKAA
jgi:hypothetical protein